MDITLKQFYDNVKDPMWPSIETYADFIKLPEYIKKECYTQHNFQQLREDIENSGDCGNNIKWVFQYQNLVYVPTLKCASTYYTTFFDSIGWKRKMFSEIDLDSVIMFGLIKDPFKRWVKGITEWIASNYYNCINYSTAKIPDNITVIDAYCRSYQINKSQLNWNQLTNDLEKTNLLNIINTVIIGDGHSVPYSLMLGKHLNRVNWIPMDYLDNDDDIKKSLMLLFQKCNHNINIPLETPRAWQSSTDKLKLENIVKESYLTSKERLYFLYKVYANDLKFYYNLLDTFDPTWQQIKGIKIQ